MRIIILISFLMFGSSSYSMAQAALGKIDSLVNEAYEEGDYKTCLKYSILAKKVCEEQAVMVDSLYFHYCNEIAFFNNRLGNFEASKTILKHLLQLEEEKLGKYSKEYAADLATLGNTYQLNGEYQKAEKTYKEVIDILEKLHLANEPVHVNALTNLATLYLNTARYKKARQLYLEILAKYPKEKKETANYSTYLSNLAITYNAIGEYEKAIAILENAVEIERKVLGEDHPDYAYSLQNLAGVYTDIDQVDKSIQLAQKARKIVEKSLGRDSYLYAHILKNLANFYSIQNQNELAYNLTVEAKAIYKKILGESHPDYAAVLRNLGALYRDMGKYKEAEKVILEAIAIQKNTYGSDHRYVFHNYNQLAQIYIHLGKLKKAEDLAKESLNSSLKLSEKTRMINLLAMVYRKANQPKKAIKLYKKNLTLLVKTESSLLNHQIANNLLGLSRTYLLTNQLDSARYHALKSLSVNSKIPLGKLIPSEIHQYSFIKSSMATIAVGILLEIADKKYINTQQKKYLEEVLLLSKQGILLTKHMKNEYQGQQDKLQVTNENKKFASKGIQAAFVLQTPEALALAFELAEYNKSILLLDAIKGKRAMNMSNLPDSIIHQELFLREKISKINIAAQQSSEGQEEKMKKLGTLESELNLLLNKLKKEYPDYYKLRYENITTSIADIQQYLNEESLLLEYFWGADHIFLFAISQKKVKLYKLPVENQPLKQAIKKLHKSLSNYPFIVNNQKIAYKNYTKTAHWLYEGTIAPALQEYALAKKLILIPDGELNHIPFEVFLTDTVDTMSYAQLPYLINKYSVNYNYSAILWNQNKTAASRNNNRQLIGFAATYTDVDSNLLSIRTENEYEVRKSLTPLHAVDAEIKLLQSLFEGKFYVGKQATERIFKQEAPQYGVIHLASHGILNKEYPMLSSLALTENKDTLENNFLQAHEITRLSLQADLVVLSACETGFGKFKQGEGVMSLARSFMYAGVPSLVVSLWSVNDQSTAIIMQDFYRNLAKNQSKDEALRQAKLAYIKKASNIAAHPAFWSPFIQLGNSEAIEIQTKSNPIYWIVGIASILVLLLGCYLFLKRKKTA